LSYQDIPLLGFAPDNDPAQPGSFVSCVGYESTTRGWKLARECAASGTIAATNYALVYGGLVDKDASGNELVYLVATDTFNDYVQYRKRNGTVISALSLASAFNHSLSQFGNYTIAVSVAGASYYRDCTTETNTFTTIGNSSPKADVCFTWGPPTAPRTMLLNYDDGTLHPNGFWTSHKGGPVGVSWTPDVATEAASGDLIGAGDLIAGIGFRDNAIAFSDNQMWVGEYAPTVIAGVTLPIGWQRISADVGCVGKRALCVGNNVLYFVGKQGLYYFDGSQPRKLRVPIQKWIVDRMADTTNVSASLTTLSFDPLGQRLLVCIRATGSKNPASYYLSINLLTMTVGMLPLTNSQGTVYAPLNNKYTVQYSSGPNATIIALEGTSPLTTTTSYIEINRLRGPGAQTPTDVTTFRRLLPRFAVAPTSFGSAYAGAKAMSDTFSFTALTTNSASPWWSEPFDQTTATANRWHGLRAYTNSNGTADPELVGLDVEFADTVSRY
jgi:hypothetical protein